MSSNDFNNDKVNNSLLRSFDNSINTNNHSNNVTNNINMNINVNKSSTINNSSLNTIDVDYRKMNLLGPNDFVFDNLKYKISKVNPRVRPNLNKIGLTVVNKEITSEKDEVSSNITKVNMPGHYINNYNEYNIREGDIQDERRVLQMSTKPAKDYSIAHDYYYNVSNPPNIQVDKWPKFYEK